ncbi:TIR domain-containing protein [Treponema sp.]|uniref:TIR domain-containing protein n=1 Tax=Treponema sp. TaxID=166 RepID=UPI00298E9E86|nr:TIR domain-containing protein [Treponema sp.]MCQ2240244.1 TIR domain-containing protein [Treponema sp.]
MHRVFISYHHANDQWYKERLVQFGKDYNIFIDGSVDTGDIPDDWDDEKIRMVIRDEYLADTTVTILLVGRETKYRKHIDWELYSSMYDGIKNKKSGIIVIHLPEVSSAYKTAAHVGEKEKVFPSELSWTTVSSREEMEKRYPFIPERIIDNLLHKGAKISVINWDDLDSSKLSYMIEMAWGDKESCDYDLSRRMRRNNSGPRL